MDSLVGYGSDDENESERYGGHLSSVSMPLRFPVNSQFIPISGSFGWKAFIYKSDETSLHLPVGMIRREIHTLV